MSAGTTKATCPMGESKEKRSTSIIVVLNGGKKHAITPFLFHADKYNRQSQCYSHPMPNMASLYYRRPALKERNICAQAPRFCCSNHLAWGENLCYHCAFSHAIIHRLQGPRICEIPISFRVGTVSKCLQRQRSC